MYDMCIRVRASCPPMTKVEITVLHTPGGGHRGGASELQGVPYPPKIALLVTRPSWPDLHDLDVTLADRAMLPACRWKPLPLPLLRAVRWGAVRCGRLLV